MSKFDNLFRNLATQLIDNTFGTSAVVQRETATYDPVAGDNTKSTVNHSVSISPPAPVNEQRLSDGSVFQRGDLVTLVAAQGISIVPNPTSDKLVWNGGTYQIVTVRPIVSGDQEAAYEMVCRR